MATPVPTLTAEGFVTAVDRKCDRLLMNLFASDASQSNMYLGKVVSIQDIIWRYSDNITEAAAEIQRKLESVFNAYFDASQFKATVTEISDKPGRYDIAIEGTVVENQRRYDFGRMVETANGLVQRILNGQGELLWQTAKPVI